MKKIFYLLILLGFMFIVPNLKAEVKHGYRESFFDECVNNQTCILLCAYENQVRYTAKFVDPPGYDYYSSYIYYSFDDAKIFVTFMTQEAERQYYYNKTDIDKNVFWEIKLIENIKNKGKCPKNSFVDTDGFGITDEVCFDDNNEYCNSDPGRIGTKFGGVSSLKYNYEDHITTYFNKLSPSITCDQLKNSNYDITTQLVDDFAQNFMYGKYVPEFVINSNSYIAGKNNKINEFNKLKNDCISNLEDSDLSDEEKETLKNEYIVGANNIINQIEELENNFSIETTKIIGSGEVLSPSIIKLLNEIYLAIRIITPILAGALSMFDFVKSMAAEDKDALKKSYKHLIVRIVIVLLIFLLPTLINLIGALTGLGKLPSGLF